MSADRQIDMPQGYIPFELPGTGITIPRPESWILQQDGMQPQAKAFSLRGINALISFTVIVNENTKSTFGKKPSEMARKYAYEQLELILLGEPTRPERPGFETYRCKFKKQDENKILLVDVMGNDEQGYLLAIIYEAPAHLWEQEEERAKLMLDSTVVAPLH